MGKTTVEQNANMYVVVNKLTHQETINESELHVIAGGSIGSLIPVVAEQSKKDVVINASIDGMISLQSYFSSLMTKKMFLNVIIQMITVVKDCEKKLMNVASTSTTAKGRPSASCFQTFFRRILLASQ